MKELARRFSAHEYDGPARGRIELRLLPQPLRRYARPESGLQDGTMFSLASGTNPDVLLLIESRRVGGGPVHAWQYGLARIGGSELFVELDGREVWTQPRALPVPQSLETYMNRYVDGIPE